MVANLAIAVRGHVKHPLEQQGNDARATDHAGADYVLLLQGVRNGDMIAFRELYDRSAPVLYATVTRVLPEASAAQDALQEGFLRIWRYAHRYSPALGQPMAWMSVIVRNAALDLVRRRRDESDIESIRSDQLPTTLPVSPDHISLNRLLKQLPRDQARAIVATYTYGLSNAELAVYMDAPLGTVKSWVTRGTASLRQMMTK